MRMRRPLLLLPFLIVAFTGCSTKAATLRNVGSMSSSSHVQDKRSAMRLSLRHATVAAAVSSVSSSVVPHPPEHLTVPILVYHHVRDASPYPKTTWSWKMSVSPAVFAKQMQWIDDHGYTPVTMTTLGKIFRGEIQGPQKPIAITFDDGNRNVLEAGLPVLQKHGFVATWYIIIQRYKDPTGYLTPDDVKNLSAMGMEIGSHTMTHAELSVIDPKDRDYELKESKKELEDLVGKPVTALAYPLTMQNQAVRDATAAAGYTTATIMDPRPATEKDSLFKLPRIMMTDDTDYASILP